MTQFPVEIYHYILTQLPPLRDEDSSVYALVSCSETNSVLRWVSTSAALWEPHYQIRYRHNDERREAERKSKLESNWRALYVERRRLESQALDMMKNVILGNMDSFLPAEGKPEEVEEDHDEHPLPWLQVIGKSIVQLGMDIFDMLDILQRTAPRRFKGAPEDVELAYEHPTSPWKSWAIYLRGLVLRHDTLSRWIHMRVDPEKMTFERALAGLSAFYGVSYVEVGGTVFFYKLVLNFVNSDIGRSGFAGVRMSDSVGVSWCSPPREPYWVEPAPCGWGLQGNMRIHEKQRFRTLPYGKIPSSFEI